MHHPPKRPPRRRLGRKLAAAAMLLGVLAAAAFWAAALRVQSRLPAMEERPEGEVMHTLALHAPETLESVTVRPRDGEAYTLRVQEGTLMLEGGGGLEPLSDTYAGALLGAVTQIVSQGTVAPDAAAVEAQLADMGLVPARGGATLRFRDGHEETLEAGAPVPNTAFYYFRWSGDPGIHMCDEEVAEALNFTVNRLSPVEQPPLDASRITTVTVKNARGSFVLEMDAEAGGMLREPFAYPLGAEAAQSLRSALGSLRLGTLEAVLTEANSAEYGFDAPLCTVVLHQRAGSVSSIAETGELVVSQEAEQDLSFCIGREEDAYFYTCAFEGRCYLVSRFLWQALAEVSAESLVTRTPANLGDTALSRIEIETQAGRVEAHIERTERVLPNNELAADETGEILYDTRLWLGGEEASQEQLDELGARLAAMTVSGDAPEGWQAAEAPRWRITLTAQEGWTRTVKGYRLDLFSDVVAVNGVALHRMDAEAIDAVTADLLP